MAERASDPQDFDDTDLGLTGIPDAAEARRFLDAVRGAAPADDASRARRLAAAAVSRHFAEEWRVIRIARWCSAAAAVLAIAVGSWAMVAANDAGDDHGGSDTGEAETVGSAAVLPSADDPEAWLASDDAETEDLAMEFLMARPGAGAGGRR